MQAMKRDLVHPRDEIMRTMERIYRYRMTTTSGGNLSIREPNGDIWITPARVDKGSLRREDIVCVRADGSVEGAHRPSSEFPFHKAIYQERPDLSGIVHAHPVALVAFSICRQSPNTCLFHQARHICGEVGFAPYALPGSERLGRNIAETFARKFDSVILENHGVAVGGQGLQNAFERFETLEFTAKTIIKAGLLGKVRYLTPQQLEWSRQHGAPLPVFEPGPASGLEKELRGQLCNFVRRGYHQRLMISTQGSFSARVDDKSFLITPSSSDRHSLESDDIVLIENGRCEAGKSPSRAARIHEAIYRQHPGVKSIVNGYPVNATAFSVTDAVFDTRTIPESYIFLREVQRIPYGLQFQDPEQLARQVSPRNPIALLENDGVLVCGTTILDAFDRLEVLETTAEAMINSRPLGTMVPMSDQVIEELVAAFLK
jgi:L-fuculose-phosphate aldolase